MRMATSIVATIAAAMSARSASRLALLNDLSARSARARSCAASCGAAVRRRLDGVEAIAQAGERPDADAGRHRQTGDSDDERGVELPANGHGVATPEAASAGRAEYWGGSAGGITASSSRSRRASQC